VGGQQCGTFPRSPQWLPPPVGQVFVITSGFAQDHQGGGCDEDSDGIHRLSPEKLAQHCCALLHTLSGWVRYRSSSNRTAMAWQQRQRNGTATMTQWRGDSMARQQQQPQCDGSKVMSTATTTPAVAITIAAAAMATTT